MPALSAYANTENTALVILRELGYRCWYENKGKENEAACCERKGWDFRADDFTQLLGVIRIFEYHSPKEYKEYWWKINEPWLIETVSDQAHDFKPIWRND